MSASTVSRSPSPRASSSTTVSRSPSPIRSPAMHAEEINLNLNPNRGRAVVPAEPYWKNKEQRNAMLTFFARRMSERFHLVFGDCFVRQVLNIIPKENGTYRVLFAGQTNAAVVQEIKTCLEQPAVQMVGIRVNYHYAANKAHSILWVINKVKKTIELYDPLGAESFITMIPDYRRIFKTIIKRNQWPVLKYTFSAITTTNPARGLQAYEHDVPSCHDIGGFCETWTFYYAELRARNVNESPKQFKLKMERRLATITAAGINLGEYLKNIILHYLLDATPTTPTTT